MFVIYLREQRYFDILFFLFLKVIKIFKSFPNSFFLV